MDGWGCGEVGVAYGLEVEKKRVDVRVYSVCFFEELVGCCGGRRARLPRRDCGACIFVLENLIKI